ncbi:MAG TPA: radical SAM protein, partial [Thermoleophilia bacterium]|nr:radical SAM protein [Thermoleophilia bacterium]
MPRQASVDLTYRCNNRCRHCWLWEADTEAERARELTTGEWRAVIDQARALGTREWAISGGEPLLREDFAELFEHVTAKATTYSLNTNGTLITPEIAQLLKRKGSKMVAVYGATADVYDRVTRNPGGFEQLLQGLAYLKEAGAGFTVQLIPMRDNWQQWDQMVAFAQSWSKHWRVGAPWLFKSACGDARCNAEIERQRLDPADVVELDQPSVAYEEREAAEAAAKAAEMGHGGVMQAVPGDDRLYAACIETRRDFHVDPYGSMSFCCFVKDLALRYDLRQGSAGGVVPGAVQTAWEDFIPSLADTARGGPEYLEGCASCELRDDCRWCDVYGYLEHGRHGARVEHLCAVAREKRAFKENWVSDHRRHFEIAGITVQVESDLPFGDTTFDRKFAHFAVDGPGGDTVVIHHHFGLPDMEGVERGEEVHRYPPWAISRREGSWIYEGISPDAGDPTLHRVAVFNDDHTRGELYNPDAAREWWRAGGLGSLSMFPSDQIWLARVLADREACYLHSGGMVIDGQGFLFVGHSDAGKSTTMELVRGALGERAEILCDDRNIVRRWDDGFKVHGTWSHGDVPDVSSAAAPLRAILFLEQSERNEIVPMGDRLLVWQRLLATLIRPLVTAEWWNKELDVLERIVDEVPCFT